MSSRAADSAATSHQRLRQTASTEAVALRVGLERCDAAAAQLSAVLSEMDDKLRALEVEARPVLERTQALSRAHANLESAYETANSILSKMDVPRRLQAALEKPIENEAGALAKYLKRVDDLIEARIFLEGKQSLKMKSAAVALVHAQEVESSVMKILRDELKKILSKGSENQEEGEDVIDAESFSQSAKAYCSSYRRILFVQKNVTGQMFEITKRMDRGQAGEEAATTLAEGRKHAVLRDFGSTTNGSGLSSSNTSTIRPDEIMRVLVEVVLPRETKVCKSTLPPARRAYCLGKLIMRPFVTALVASEPSLQSVLPSDTISSIARGMSSTNSTYESVRIPTQKDIIVDDVSEGVSTDSVFSLTALLKSISRHEDALEEQIFALNPKGKAIEDFDSLEIVSLIRFIKVLPARIRKALSHTLRRNFLDGISSEKDSSLVQSGSMAVVRKGGPKDGTVHPLTFYVVNFLQRFKTEDLDMLLRGTLSPSFLESAIDKLVQSIEVKAKSTKLISLSNLFLMNNIRFIERACLPNSLNLRDHATRLGKRVFQYEVSYRLHAWQRTVDLLAEDMIQETTQLPHGRVLAIGQGTSLHKKTSQDIKNAYKGFNTAVDESLAQQSEWVVPDTEIRSRLINNIKQDVLPKYRRFYDVFDGHKYIFTKSPAKYVKYKPEDVESIIDQLFQGRKVSDQR